MSAACAVGLLMALGCSALLRPANEATFAPSGREVVAFVPLERRSEAPRDEYAATITALRRALRHVSSCAGLADADAHLILVERITVDRDGEREVFRATGPAGIVLMDGGRTPRRIDPGPNPDAIERELAAAAADYFDAPSCRGAPVSRKQQRPPG